MKKLGLVTVIFALSGCFHDSVDEPEKIVPVIEYPDLPEQQAFDALQEDATLMALNVENAETLISDFIFRIMNTLEIANQQADIVATNSTQPSPAFKPSSRSLNLLFARTSGCVNPDADNKTNTESVVWDDVNNDGKPLEGDKWFYIIENCENKSNSAFITGVIEYSGMPDPFAESLDETNQNDYFSGYQYKFDIQIDQNQKNVFYQDMVLTLGRDIDDEDADITELHVSNGSKFGVKTDEGMYIFSTNDIAVVANDDAQTLSFDIAGTNYLQTTDGNESFNISTPESLVFSFDYDTSDVSVENKYINIKLESGKLEIVGANNSSILMSITEDETIRLQLDEDGDETLDKNYEIGQSAVFGRSDFTLLNITGE